jgi:hypothetical protein
MTYRNLLYKSEEEIEIVLKESGEELMPMLE